MPVVAGFTPNGKSRLKGLPLSVSTVHIQGIASAYTRKRTEYRRKRQLMLPPLDLLLREIKELQSHVFNHVAEF